jgi:hypothetical protein
MNTSNQLRLNGYACGDDAGVIETRKTPHSRWDHARLGVIRIDIGSESKIAKDFIAKVLAADCIEPGALVGVGRTGAIVIFKVAGTLNADNYLHYRREAREEFVLSDKQCTFMATDTAQLIDLAAYGTWKDGRSPLTVHRDLLSPMFLDHSTAVLDAIKRLLPAAAGRMGMLVEPKLPWELKLEQSRAERAARAAAGISEEEDTPESADEKLVAAHPDLRATDGPIGVLVHEARRRVDARKSAERAEAKRLAQEEKDARKRAKDMAAHVAASA